VTRAERAGSQNGSVDVTVRGQAFMGNKQVNEGGEANAELKKRLKSNPQHVETEITRGKAAQGEKLKVLTAMRLNCSHC
jgi:hypothetical protein